MLADYPAKSLFEVIPDFHNTRKRFEALKEAIEKDIAGRKHLVEKEIEFALSQEYYIDTVVDGLASGEIPLRVTHNDTKINNVLFDKDTEEGICVIDLDTVMPGSLLYDFGDALRAGATTGAGATTTGAGVTTVGAGATTTGAGATISRTMAAVPIAAAAIPHPQW